MKVTFDVAGRPDAVESGLLNAVSSRCGGCCDAFTFATTKERDRVWVLLGDIGVSCSPNHPLGQTLFVDRLSNLYWSVDAAI